MFYFQSCNFLNKVTIFLAIKLLAMYAKSNYGFTINYMIFLELIPTLFQGNIMYAQYNHLNITRNSLSIK